MLKADTKNIKWDRCSTKEDRRGLLDFGKKLKTQKAGGREKHIPPNPFKNLPCKKKCHIEGKKRAQRGGG